jgi:hypothetical protein
MRLCTEFIYLLILAGVKADGVTDIGQNCLHLSYSQNMNLILGNGWKNSHPVTGEYEKKKTLILEVLSQGDGVRFKRTRLCSNYGSI